MSDRTQYQIQVCIKKPGTSVIQDDQHRGTEDDEWESGYILTMTEGGRAATLAATIDSTSAGPVKFLALQDFDGTDATTYEPMQTIEADTILCAQVKTGSADADTVGKRGVLYQDTTTGFYAVDVSSDTNASIEVVDVEPQYQPFGEYADGDYNLVYFKFLPAMLTIAPAEVSS